MKPSLTRYLSRTLCLSLLMLFSLPGHAVMKNSTASATEQVSRVAAQKRTTTKAKKMGVIKKIKLVRDLKKAFKKQPAEGEKASTMARVALILFLSSFLVSWLQVPFISLLAGLAFLTSIVLAFIILFGDENRKSRAIAKAILIVSAILIVLTFVLILAWAAAWG